jgi:hypothetical protein
MAGPRAALGEGDVARVDLPARGRYVLWLLLTTRQGSSSSGAMIANSPEPIVIGDAREQAADLQLDEAAVKRLREAVARR